MLTQNLKIDIREVRMFTAQRLFHATATPVGFQRAFHQRSCS